MSRKKAPTDKADGSAPRPASSRTGAVKPATGGGGKASLIRAGPARAKVERARLVAIVEGSDDAIFAKSLDGRILTWNEGAERLYGYTAAEVIGQPVTMLAPPDRAAEVDRILRVLAQGGHVDHFETVRVRKGGARIDVTLSISPIKDAGGNVVEAATIARDITERKRVESRIAQLNRLLRTISEINQLIVRERDRDRMLKEACRILIERGEFLMAWVGFADEASGVVVPAVWAGREDGYLRSITVRFDDTPLGRGPTGSAIREGPGIIVNDWETDESVAPWREDGRRHGYRSSASFPLVIGGKILGALTVYMGEAGAFDADLTDLLSKLSGEIAFALETMDAAARRETAEHALRESEERFRRLSNAAFEGVAITDQGRLVDVNASLAEILRCPPVELIGRRALDFVDPADHSLVSEHFRSGSEDAYEHVMVRTDGTRFPAEVQGRNLPYGGKTLRVTAIRDVTERKRADDLKAAIYEISEAAQQGGRLDDLFASVHRILGRLMNAKNFYIALHDPTTDLISFPYFVDEMDATPEPFPCGPGMTSYVIRSGLPLLATPGVLKELEAQGEVLRLGADSIDWLGVPLKVEDRVIGALAVQSYVGDVRYSEADKKVLSYVSAQVAQAIERRRAEETVRESQARYQALFESANDANFLTKDGRFVDCNARTLALFGCDREQILNHSPAEFSPETQRNGSLSAPSAQARMQAALAGEPQSFVWLHCRQDRSLFDAEVSLKRIDLGGEAFLQAIVRDITAQKQADELRSAIYEISEAAQRAASLDNVFAAVHRIVGRLMAARNFYVALHDSDTGLLTFPYYVDEFDPPPAPRLFGRGMTEYVLRTAKPQFINPEVFEHLVQRAEIEPVGTPPIEWLGVPLKVQDRVIGVLAVQSYSGTVRYDEADKAVLSYVSAQVAQAIEHKRTEDRLRENEERFRGAFDDAGTGMALVALDGHWLRVNRALCEIVGYAEAELLTKTFQDITHPADLVRDVEHRRKLLAGEIRDYQTEKRYLHKDGRTVWAFLNVSLVRDSNRRPLYFVSHVNDLTDRRELEGQLLQAQKMEAVGSLAGGVAHDFNNLLQALLSQTQLLQTYAHDPERVKALGLELGQQISHGASLTRQLLLFSRRETTRPEPLDLNEAVGSATKMLRRLVRANIAVEIELAAKALPVTADRGQLEQVLVNLTVNASDAMPEGGKLTIRTGALDSRPRVVERGRTPGSASPSRSATASSSRSSPPRERERARGSGSRSCTAS